MTKTEALEALGRLADIDLLHARSGLRRQADLSALRSFIEAVPGARAAQQEVPTCCDCCSQAEDRPHDPWCRHYRPQETPHD